MDSLRNPPAAIDRGLLLTDDRRSLSVPATAKMLRADSNGNSGRHLCGARHAEGWDLPRDTVVDRQSQGWYRRPDRSPSPRSSSTLSSSQRGSTVAVIGSNFPAEDVITISYRGRTVTAANTDTVGRFPRHLQLCRSMPPSARNTRWRQSPRTRLMATMARRPSRPRPFIRVPDEILEVSPEIAAPGTRIDYYCQ